MINEARNAKNSRRRTVLKMGAIAISAPNIWIPNAMAASRIFVRTAGGAYDEVRKATVYEPFKKATGIEVVPVAANLAKLFAMFKSGNVELDVVDSADAPLTMFERAGALAPIPYSEFKFSQPEEIRAEYRQKFQMGCFTYASVMAYNTSAFSPATAPKTWEEFWDAGKFPGARMLSDIAAGAPDLEFALLADGVKMEELYPLDINRAFNALTRLRPSIRKFWDSGALPGQMLSDREVVLGSIWSNRALDAMKRGAPIGLNWNQHMVLLQSLAITKGARNPQGAKQFVDFCASSKVQKDFAMVYGAAPTNTKAYGELPKEVLQTIPGTDPSRSSGFRQNSDWWIANRDAVGSAWSKWVLNR